MVTLNLTQPSSSPGKQILQVSQLNAIAKNLLEQEMGSVWIEAEISNLARPQSGHIYLTLKDSQAQIKAAFFKQSQRGHQLQLANGQQVLVNGKVSLYAPRGDYQLIISHIEPAGAGLLQQAFEDLKVKLEQQGLFAAEHKQPLPKIPARIGIVTSSTGAALQDILNVLARRLPSLEIIIYPTRVQGAEAAAEIASAIAVANRRHEVDVLIVGRGGGSLEDLWPFNEEVVAHAIYQSKLPIISAVGHQTDFSIADFVADVRAPTPSAAAELATPDWQELFGFFAGYERHFTDKISLLLTQWRAQVSALARHVRHPLNQIHEQMQRLDDIEQRLQFGVFRRIKQQRNHLHYLETRLKQQNPSHQLNSLKKDLNSQTLKLKRAMQLELLQQRQRMEYLAQNLFNLSPKQTLERGYVIARNAQGKVIDKARLAAQEHELNLEFVDGQVSVSLRIS